MPHSTTPSSRSFHRFLHRPQYFPTDPLTDGQIDKLETLLFQLLDKDINVNDSIDLTFKGISKQEAHALIQQWTSMLQRSANRPVTPFTDGPATAAQWKYISGLFVEHRFTTKAARQRVAAECDIESLEELTKSQANRLIRHLKSL